MIKFNVFSIFMIVFCVGSALQALDLQEYLMPETKIAGVYVVTSSETEGHDIPALWDAFRREMHNTIEAKNDPVYVVYTDYTGDCRKNNPYTVVIGYEASIAQRFAGQVMTVTIPAALYKSAQKVGSFPDNVIVLWDEIFNSEFEQNHTINFERFTGDLDCKSRVEIFLAQ